MGGLPVPAMPGWSPVREIFGEAAKFRSPTGARLRPCRAASSRGRSRSPVRRDPGQALVGAVLVPQLRPDLRIRLRHRRPPDLRFEHAVVVGGGDVVGDLAVVRAVGGGPGWRGSRRRERRSRTRVARPFPIRRRVRPFQARLPSRRRSGKRRSRKRAHPRRFRRPSPFRAHPHRVRPPRTSSPSRKPSGKRRSRRRWRPRRFHRFRRHGRSRRPRHSHRPRRPRPPGRPPPRRRFPRRRPGIARTGSEIHGAPAPSARSFPPGSGARSPPRTPPRGSHTRRMPAPRPVPARRRLPRRPSGPGPERPGTGPRRPAGRGCAGRRVVRSSVSASRTRVRSEPRHGRFHGPPETGNAAWKRSSPGRADIMPQRVAP